jgi:two-component system chemotaxis response regulator CheB
VLYWKPVTSTSHQPGHHLLDDDHRVVLTVGPWENGYRPAINALFRSVALDYGPCAVGVLLSGLLDDGVAGLAAIRDRGGVTIVQEPSDALFPDLPRNAVKAGVAQHEVVVREIGDLLKQLANREIEEPEMDPDGLLELENRIAMSKRFAISFDPEDLGPPTTYTCPICKGTLMAVAEDTYRCPIGHAWSAQSLLFARDEELEEAVSVAVRILREKAKLSHQLAESAGPETHNRYTALASEAEHTIAVLVAGLSESQQTGLGQTPVGSC